MRCSRVAVWGGEETPKTSNIYTTLYRDPSGGRSTVGQALG